MMTFKDLKKLVELPSYKEQRVPTVKALEVSGVPVVTEKVLENHGSMEKIKTRKHDALKQQYSIKKATIGLPPKGSLFNYVKGFDDRTWNYALLTG